MKFNEGVAPGRGYQTRAEPATGRIYGMFIPHNYDPSKKYPTIVFLHGMFEAGDDIEGPMRSGIGPVTVERSKYLQFIVVFPQAHGEWRTAGELDFAQGVLNDVKKNYRVDPDRIIVTGFSTGGWGTWAMGEKFPNQFAALVPICGRERMEAVPLIKDVPVWAFHNRIDPIILANESENMIDALKKAGAKDARLTIYDTVGHDAWSQAYREEALWTWMAQQHRAATASGR